MRTHQYLLLRRRKPVVPEEFLPPASLLPVDDGVDCHLTRHWLLRVGVSARIDRRAKVAGVVDPLSRSRVLARQIERWLAMAPSPHSPLELVCYFTRDRGHTMEAVLTNGSSPWWVNADWYDFLTAEGLRFTGQVAPRIHQRQAPPVGLAREEEAVGVLMPIAKPERISLSEIRRRFHTGDFALTGERSAAFERVAP